MDATTTSDAVLRARRQGWMLGGTEQERADWQDECFVKGVDWLTLARRGRSLHLACLVHPSHQLSDIAYMEVSELFDRLGPHSGSLGANFRGNASQFQFTLSADISVEDLAKNVLEILRYDRTPRRRVERQAEPALVEGLAVAQDSTGLWEGHDPHDRVYVMQMEGRPGRCLVFKHLHPVLVDLPLSSFRILAEIDA